MSRLRGRIFGSLEQRVEARVETRVMQRIEATLDVITDQKLLEDLRRADSQPDEDATPLEDLLRGGRAEAQT